MPDILLIIPKYDMSRICSAITEDIRAVPNNIQVYPFMGVFYLAQQLIKDGFRVAVLDITAENLDLDQAVLRVKEISPDIAGIYTSSFSLHYVYSLTARLKKEAGIQVILGGPHITADPSSLTVIGADYAIAGEAMKSLPEFMRALKQKNDMKIENLYVNGPGGLISPESVELEVPVELYDKYSTELFPPKAYRSPFSGEKSSSLITSFGCPHKCIFCMSGQNVRYRSVAAIIDELKYLKKHGYSYFSFQDDTLTLDRRRVYELCDALISSGIDITWDCTTRADLIEEDMFAKIKEAGCRMVSMSVETANRRLRQEVLNKCIEKSDLERAFAVLKKLGFQTCIFFISGIPGETKDDIELNSKLIKELSPDFIDYNLLVAIPGTELFETGVKNGVFRKDVWDRVILYNETPPVYTGDEITIEDLRAFQKKIVRKFYFSPGNIYKKLRACSSWKDLTGNAASALKLINYFKN